MRMMKPVEQLKHTAHEIAEKAEELMGNLERMASFEVIITLKPFEVETYEVKKIYWSKAALQGEKEEE